MNWTPDDLAHYNRLITDRERRRHESRHIPAVVVHFGERIEIPGWHDGTPRFRIPDDILPANFAGGIVATGNRPQLRRSRKNPRMGIKFGRTQKRQAPTKEKG